MESKPISSYPYYSITSNGKVFRSYYKNGNAAFPMEPREVAQYLTNSGYFRVVLSHNNVRKMFLVHRLVLETYVGRCPPGEEGAHLNGIKTDNRVQNLAWVTSKENQYHKRLHGKMPLGSNTPSSRLIEDQVLLIKLQLKQGVKAKTLAEKYGVHKNTISDIKRNLSWKHIELNAE